MHIQLVVKGLIQKDDSFLLVKRSQIEEHSPNKWSTPGGGVEAHETIIQALHREIAEEVSLTVTPVRVFDTKHFTGTDKDTVIVVYVHCKYESGEVILNEEHDEYRWVNAIPTDISIPTSLKKCLRTFLKRK